MKRKLQRLLTELGTRTTPGLIRQLNACLNYLETGRWMHAHGHDTRQRIDDRGDFHRHVAQRVASERVAYLEFGVFEGVSLRLWSSLLQHPAAALHGFDSFEGLPEDWDRERRKATFSVGGRLPQFEDPRVHLHKGWFQDTLPGFRIPDHDRLVVHLDADLYSSTIYVLEQLEHRIQPGTVLIFDEFCDRLHELRAFDGYLEATGSRFRCVASSTNLEHVAFECELGSQRTTSDRLAEVPAALSSRTT